MPFSTASFAPRDNRLNTVVMFSRDYVVQKNLISVASLARLDVAIYHYFVYKISLISSVISIAKCYNPISIVVGQGGYVSQYNTFIKIKTVPVSSMNVFGNGFIILDGDPFPTMEDYTDFGDVRSLGNAVEQ